MQFCKTTGLRTVNGRIGSDRYIGKYTCTCINGQSSSVDMMLTKENLFQLFNTFSVDDPNIISDHCVDEFSLKSYFKQSENSTTNVLNTCNTTHIR